MDDSSSQVEAEAILAYLTEEGFCREKAVILVANKTDLVRNKTKRRFCQFVNSALVYFLLTSD